MLGGLAGVFGALTFASIGWAADQPQYGPDPTWVRPAPIPAPAPGASGAAVQVLLRDSQLSFGPDGDDYYLETATKILSAQGLSVLGNILLAWQPDTETLTIHHLEIIRGDQHIDLLQGGKKVTVVRRETNLELAMLDGTLTATVQPEGLQIGDVLHVAFTVRSHDPALHGVSSGFWALAQTPIEHDYLRAVWPTSKQIRWRASDGVAAPKVVAGPAGPDFVVDMANAEAPTPPRGAPSRFANVGQLEFSQFDSWSGVSDLMTPLYGRAATLAADSPLRKQIDRIAAQSPDPAARAMAALRLTQDDVRYVFLGMSDGGYVPAAADLTWQRRFGDCKGKTALLLALLKGLGVEAEPAFVSTEQGDGLDERLPSLRWFDHVLVRAVIGGKVYWLDGTRAGDRNLADLPVPDYHWVLRLQASGAVLERLAPPPFDVPQFESAVTLDATAGLDAPAPAHAEHLLRGDNAIGLRLALASLSHDDADRYLKDYWRNAIAWIEPRQVTFASDETNGTLRLSMDGSARIDWSRNDAGRDFNVEDSSLGFEPDFQRAPGPHADAPFAFNYPTYKKATVTVRLPGGGKDFVLANAASIDETVGPMKYHRSAQLIDGAAIIEASERALAPELSADDAKADRAEFVRLADHDVVIRSASGASGKGSASDLLSLQTLLAGALAKYRSGDSASLLTDLKAAIAMPSMAQLQPEQRRSVLTLLSWAADAQSDYALAHRSAVEALTLDDGDQNVWRLRLASAAQLKDQTDVALCLTALAKRWPASLSTFSDEYLIRLPSELKGVDLTELLLAIHDAHWSPSDPLLDKSWLWFELLKALVKKGDITAAATVARDIDLYDVLIEMRADKRFDPITKADPDRYDVAKAVASELAASRRIAAAQPDKLEAINNLADLLIATGRFAEAQKLVEDAIAKAHVDPDAKPAFADVDDQLNWTFEKLAQVLALQGRNDEAVKARQRGAQHAERGKINVSQRLNLAEDLNELGKPHDALDTLADFDPHNVSPYGAMVWQEALACAYAELGDRTNLEKSLQYLKAHREEGSHLYAEALLCAGDETGYAKDLIARLDDVESRSVTLRRLQTFLTPPASSPWNAQQHARIKSVTERTDVRAEIEKVGRIETYPIYEP